MQPAMRAIIYSILILVFFQANSFAQSDMYAVGAYYDDTFAEWVVYYGEEETGTIRMKWPLKEDWTQWEVFVGETEGFVKQRWSNKPGHWEAKINDQVIDMRPVFPRDYSQWILKSQEENVRLHMVYSDTVENWSIETKDGYFDFYTTYLGDVRDWSIEDSLGDQLSTELKLAAITLILYHSCPKI